MSDQLKEVYDTLLALVSSKLDYEDTLPSVYTLEELQGACLDLNRYVHRNMYRLSETDNAVPPGYWYMVTVTQEAAKDRSDIVALHEVVLKFFKEQHIKVHLASLEHSNIWHTHYLICATRYIKNLQRDLGKRTGTRVKIERKITTSKRWYGACNYVTKRNYPADETHQEMLVEELEHIEGKGWCFKN